MVLDKMMHKEIVKKTYKKLHIKCMEELSELGNCLSCKCIDETHLAEEICDVYISLYRLRLYVNSGKRVYIQTRNFNMKECMYHITNMQIYISKGYLYNDYRDVYYDTMGCIYSMLNCLMDRYNIRDNVQEWIKTKEIRDRSILESNRFSNNVHIY